VDALFQIDEEEEEEEDVPWNADPEDASALQNMERVRGRSKPDAVSSSSMLNS